jgi:adenine/guanine phosphoribosyltransferase-like PRPP-binding protein
MGGTGATAEATRKLAKQAGIRLTHIGPSGKGDAETYRQAFAASGDDKPEGIVVLKAPRIPLFRG